MATSRVVIAPNWIGDSVMAIPFIRAVKRAHPEDRLAVLARRGPAAIFRAEGNADVVLTRAGLLADVSALRRGRFEQVWLLPNSFRAALTAFLAGIPERIGYATDRRTALLTRALPPPQRTVHQLRDYDGLLEAHGIEPDREPPRLFAPPEASARAREALSRAGLESADPLVLLAPGATFGWTKRWPAERFGQLASALFSRGLCCGIVIGPGEQDLARRVSAASGIPLAVLGEDLDPVGIAALFSRARVVVANDSGPAHLAAAAGTPVVALFGPTDPGRTAPTGAQSRILDRYVFCSPCFLKECPYGHECMKEITVEDALRAVEEVLAE